MFSLPSLGGILNPSGGPSVDSIRFKTDRVNGIARLYSEQVPASEHRFYSSILTHFHSTSHAFDTFSVKDARQIRDRQPENFRTLLILLTLHLESLKRDERFVPRPGTAAATAAAAAGELDGEEGGMVAGFTAGLGKWASVPFGGAAAGSSRVQPRNRTKEALNCARLLARLLPVLMEDAGGPGAVKDERFTSILEEDVLWTRHRVAEQQDEDPAAAAVAQLADQTQDQFVIDDDEEEADASKDPLTSQAGPSSSEVQPAEAPLQEPLAERLIHLSLDFLFFPGFTLPHLSQDEEEDSPDGSRVHPTIWSKGVGSSVDLPGTTRQHVAHRIDFLRLLLVLLSKAVYVPPPAQEGFRDRALEFACTSLSRTISLPLLCSLLNAACADTGNAGGWSLLPGFAAGGSPGSHEAEGGKEMLRALSLQLLAVLLDWQPQLSAKEGNSLDVSSQQTDGDATSDTLNVRPDLSRTVSTASSSSTVAPAGAGTTSSSSSLGANQFTYWLSKIHRPADLSLLSSRLFTLLRPAASSASASGSGGSAFNLPGVITAASSSAAAFVTGGSGINSTHGIYHHSPEALTVLWRLLMHTPKFRTHVLTDPLRAPTLLGILLSHALLGKDSPPSHGMVRLSLFSLQDISSHPGFGEQIAKAGSQQHCQLPGKVVGANPLLAGGAGGLQSARSAGDVLVSACHALVATRGMGSSGLALAPSVLIALANIAPSLTSLSVASAAKLGLLLAHVSRPAFLLADEGHPRLAFFVLEACNAILVNEDENKVKGNANVVYSLLGRQREVARLRGFSLRKGLAEIQESRGGLGTDSAIGEGGGTPQPLSAEEEKARLKAQEVQPVIGQTGEAEAEAAPSAPSEKALGKARSAEVDGEGATVPQVGGATAAGSSSQDSTAVQSTEPLSHLSSQDLAALCSSLSLSNPRTGFTPTEAWVESWAPHLPLGPLAALHDDATLRAGIEERSKQGGAAEAVRWLKSDQADVRGIALRGLGGGTTEAPQPVRRPFRWTPAVSVWLRSYIWGAVYLLQALPYSLWPQEGVRLFVLVGQGQGLKGEHRGTGKKVVTGEAAQDNGGQPPADADREGKEGREADGQPSKGSIEV
ncbi:hypothetical protein BDZ90DRAFT_279081 [Jaminaea rosea]|uniref:Uncharacterized protein n=1 Tax=Jaminaea rosea TaxID=1569628 RepID=A0A316UUD3_9BASI|nr:hypothetical protein BDZ90DRAFT_279081 [Jaminaea rosea]PWN27931.1 hypothetical protein BDZ90DRAFT_279081 [Jaminaea rosea]